MPLFLLLACSLGFGDGTPGPSTSKAPAADDAGTDDTGTSHTYTLLSGSTGHPR